MNKLRGILKYVSLDRKEGANPIALSKRIEKLRKVSRRMRAVSRSSQSLDPVISQKLEQARKQ